MAVDDTTKKKIDEWIKKNGRNEYGDPRDTVYAGGNPLFDERRPGLKDRYEYILERNPELRQK
jgi:hypothetical protein